MYNGCEEALERPSDQYMSNHDLTKQEQELKSTIMDELEDAVDAYFNSFRSKSNGGKSLPSINDIEDLANELKTKTRDIYLAMISSGISTFDESEAIASKKENSKKEGWC